MRPKSLLGKKLLSLIVLSVLSFFPLQAQTSSPQVEAPRLLDAKITAEKQLYLEGLTDPNTRVMVYVDGSFNNYANVKEKTEEGVNSFSYLSDSQLSPGRYDISVIAQEKNSSLLSPPTDYEIPVYGQTPEKDTATKPVPSPILITPESNNLSNVRPKITGLAANNTKVLFYLDGELMGGTGFVFHPSGTAGFTFMPSEDVPVGEHELWAVAIDSSERRSKRSNTINFSITSVEGVKTKPQEPSEPEKISIKAPQILFPQEGATITSEQLEIKAKTDQIVEEIDVYINDSLVKTLVPTIKQDRFSEINYKPEELSRGSHTLCLVARKNEQVGPASSEVNFTIIEPKINDGAREEGATTSPEKEKDATTSTEQKKDPATSSQSLLNKDSKRYLAFAGIVILILAALAWTNRDFIRKRFQK